MLKLCGFPLSNYYNKVKIVLLEKGIPFEEENCNVSQEPAMLARSPMGKVPFLDLGNGQCLSESEVIVQYLEETHPGTPLMPADALARARVRELSAYLELHLELVARRLYAEAFFGGKVSDETKQQVEKELAKGVRGLLQLAKFSPFIAGAELTLADASGITNLLPVGQAAKAIYGRDIFAEHPQVRAYTTMMLARPSVKKVYDDRKAFLQSQPKG